MDSVKLWDLERPGLADIIMKPQSLIFDMRGNSEYLYSKYILGLTSVLVAEYNTVHQSVILSQISMSDLNLKAG